MCTVRNTVLRDQLGENVRRLKVHSAFLKVILDLQLFPLEAGQ